MALDVPGIIANLTATNWVLLFIVFILFVLAAKKVLKIVMNAIWITVAAFLFPIFANRVLGLAVPADIDSILLLATAGLALYFVYLIAKSVYSVLGMAQKLGKKMAPKVELRGKDGKKGKEVKGKKSFAEEKPKRGEPLPKHYYAAGDAKSEKDLYKGYVVLEDNEKKSADDTKDVKKTYREEDDYVEINEKGGKANEEAESMKDEPIEKYDKMVEEEKKFMREANSMESLREIKFKSKGKKKGKK